MTPENGKNDTKYDEKIQNTDFLLVSDFVPRDFFVGIVSYMSVPIFVHVRET